MSTNGSSHGSRVRTATGNVTPSPHREAVLVLEDGVVTRHSPGVAALLGETDVLGRSLGELLPGGVDRERLADGPVTVVGENRDRALRIRATDDEDAEWVTVETVTSVEDHYGEILAAMTAPAYLTDAEGRVTYVNRAFEETFGYDRSALVEADSHFSTFTTSDATRQVRNALSDLSQAPASGPRTMTITAVASDGRELPVEASILALSGDATFRGSAGVVRPIGDRQRREELLTVIDRALRHDLRTHVNAIDGYASAVDERTDDATTETFLERIGESASWLGQLGETLRTIQKAIEEERTADTVADSERILESVARRYRRQYPEATIETHVETDRDVAAGRAIEYVLDELVKNAVVHNDAEAPAVDVWLVDAPRDGWVDVHVEDDGPGVPEAERAVVLGEAEITQLNHGSGVGLWVCRWIVDAFDGEIHIEEESGTVVTARLRCASDDGGT